MTKNGLDIQTISTKRTDKQADRVLLLGQVTEKKKSPPFAFFKISFCQPHKRHIGFCPTHNPTLRKTQRAVSANAPTEHSEHKGFFLPILTNSNFQGNSIHFQLIQDYGF